MNIPLIPVDTLQILCAAVMEEIPADALLCPMLDARRMEVYTAIYTTSLQPQSEVSAKVIDQQSFAEALFNKNIYFFGNGAEKCQSVITSANAHFVTGILPQAKHMGRLAEKAVALDIKQMAYYEPFYLKDFVPAPSHVKGLT
jgi:tRNA threonylcarbamoyladenosine biosynthesis protein TsaB